MINLDRKSFTFHSHWRNACFEKRVMEDRFLNSRKRKLPFKKRFTAFRGASEINIARSGLPWTDFSFLKFSTFVKQIRDHKDVTQCISCRQGTVPDETHSACRDIPEEFLRPESGWAIGAMSFSATGILVSDSRLEANVIADGKEKTKPKLRMDIV